MVQGGKHSHADTERERLKSEREETERWRKRRGLIDSMRDKEHARYLAC